MILRILFFLIIVYPTKVKCQDTTIFFKEFELKISHIDKLLDTVVYFNKSGEKFIFVFYDFKGKSYCERYSHGELKEKGFFTTIDKPTEVLLSARNQKGQTKPVSSSDWFLPVKNGEWTTYANNVVVQTRRYAMGVLQK